MNSIASLRPYSWAKYWTLAGHQVTVLTTKKYDHLPSMDLHVNNPGYEVIEANVPSPFTSLKNDYHEKSSKNQKQKHIHRFFNVIRNRTGIFNACRMPDITHFWIKPAIKALDKSVNWDLIISTSGPYTVHILAEKLKRKLRIDSWIADFRDLWSENHAYPGIFPFSRIERKLERNLMKSADLITTVSDPLKQKLGELHEHNKVFTIENGFDSEMFKNISSKPVFPNDDKFRIVYTGMIYPKFQDPTPLFQTINQIYDSEILNHLEILFYCKQGEYLEKLIRKFNVGKWVKSMGYVPYQKSLQIQRDAHALLFLPWNDQATDGIISGKIFEYLFSRTPIISVGAQTIETAQKMILQNNAGYVFNDLSQIKNYLQEKLKKITKEKTDIDLNILERYDRKFLSNKMLELIT